MNDPAAARAVRPPFETRPAGALVARAAEATIIRVPSAARFAQLETGATPRLSFTISASPRLAPLTPSSRAGSGEHGISRQPSLARRSALSRDISSAHHHVGIAGDDDDEDEEHGGNETAEMVALALPPPAADTAQSAGAPATQSSPPTPPTALRPRLASSFTGARPSPSLGAMRLPPGVAASFVSGARPSPAFGAVRIASSAAAAASSSASPRAAVPSVDPYRRQAPGKLVEDPPSDDGGETGGSPAAPAAAATDGSANVPHASSTSADTPRNGVVVSHAHRPRMTPRQRLHMAAYCER